MTTRVYFNRDTRANYLHGVSIIAGNFQDAIQNL